MHMYICICTYAGAGRKLISTATNLGEMTWQLKTKLTRPASALAITESGTEMGLL